MNGRHNFIREGIVAGVIGATVIAVWFFIVDLIAGQPLFTPQLLGEGLLGILGMPSSTDPTFLHIGLYTIFHYVVFMVVGVVVVAIVHQGERTPGMLAGLLILFVAFQLGAYGMTAVFMETPLGGLAWYQVFIANLLAAASMGWWIWKRHPGVGEGLRAALEGTDEQPGRFDTSEPERAREITAEHRVK